MWVASLVVWLGLWPVGAEPGPGLADGPVEDFVKGFYHEVLGRDAGRAEVSTWINYIRSTRTMSAASAMIHTFFDGPEHRSQPTTLAAEVALFYRLLLGREASLPEIDGWVGAILNGFEPVISTFVNSPEFRSLLPSFQDREAVAAVVRRLYREVLGRTAGADEVGAWTDYLVVTGDLEGVARGFLESREYVGASRTLTEHTQVLYRTFLNRAAAAAEVGPWVDHFGAQIGLVLDGFITSPEFQRRFTGAPAPGPSNHVLAPLLQRPFDGQYPSLNLFDHNVPQQFVDANGIQIAYWGERVPFYDGHRGYDFFMPEGVPILAAADGTVTFSGTSDPVFCLILDRETTGPVVEVQHVLPDGTTIRSGYLHLSRVDVSVGEQVRAGQRVGLSGNTGCSLAPHLHFQVHRFDTRSRTFVVIDPYGWEGQGSDPWAEHPAGTESFWLWIDGLAPGIFSEFRRAPNASGSTAPVALTVFRWMGPRDDENPNNEFVEVSLDGRFAPVGPFDLTGYTLGNNRGDTFAFPPGFTIQADRPVRVYTGPGTNTESELFWGRSAGVFDNLRDCVFLANARGVRYILRSTADAC